MLRALKDLELEHSVGKIDDEDYAQISARYREQAKGLLREMDIEIEPLRPKAEALARAYLEKRGFAPGARARTRKAVARARRPTTSRSTSPVARARRVRRTVRPRTSRTPRFARSAALAWRGSSVSRAAASNEPDAAFCKKCGASLRQEAGAERSPVTEVKGA